MSGALDCYLSGSPNATTRSSHRGLLRSLLRVIRSPSRIDFFLRMLAGLTLLHRLMLLMISAIRMCVLLLLLLLLLCWLAMLALLRVILLPG